VIFGITGTRQGLNRAQRNNLPVVFSSVMPEGIVHGGAVGADEEVDAFLAPLYAENFRYYPILFRPIEIHPCTKTRRDYWAYNALFRELRVIAWPDEDPLRRNRLIVKKVDQLIAFPATDEETKRGGTWYTVRQAHLAGVPVTLILPNGEIVI